MRITGRFVDKKRHTVAYRIDGERVTRGKAVKLARRGKISNVVPKKGPAGWYISTKPTANTKLYDLPMLMDG